MQAAIGNAPPFNILVNNAGTNRPKMLMDVSVDDFDVIVIHYSAVLSSPLYFSPHLLDKLRRFRGLKILFIQDDYRWVDRATAAARDAGINVLFTVAPEPLDGAVAWMVEVGAVWDERLAKLARALATTGRAAR